MINYNHVALVGLGLISSSIALSIKRKNKNIRVTGTSRSSKTRELARKLNICEVFDNISDTVENADLVILCVPVGAMSNVSVELLSCLKKGSTVTDVGSVKKEVKDVILDVDMVLDDINAKAERQVEWRLTDARAMLSEAELSRSARALDTISIRIRNRIWEVVAEAREDIHAVYKIASNEMAEKE